MTTMYHFSFEAITHSIIPIQVDMKLLNFWIQSSY